MSVPLLGCRIRARLVSVLEQLSTDESDQNKIISEVPSPLVTEAMVLGPAIASRSTRWSTRSTVACR